MYNSISVEAITFQCQSGGKCRLNVKKLNAKKKHALNVLLVKNPNKLTHRDTDIQHLHIFHMETLFCVYFFFLSHLNAQSQQSDFSQIELEFFFTHEKKKNNIKNFPLNVYVYS